MPLAVARQANASVPFPNASVGDVDNELYTHFIPLVPDFSRSKHTETGLFKPNRTLHKPHLGNDPFRCTAAPVWRPLLA